MASEVEQSIARRIMSLQRFGPAGEARQEERPPRKGDEFGGLIADINREGDGLSLCLLTVRDSRKLDSKQKERLRDMFSQIEKQTIRLGEAKRQFNQDICKKVREFIGSLRDFVDALRDLGSAGFCGGGEKALSLELAAQKVQGYHHMFEVLRYVDGAGQSSDTERAAGAGGFSEALERVKNQVLGEVANLAAREELFLRLHLMPHPTRALALLEKVADCQWVRGRMHEDGIIFQANPEKARQCYESSMRKGQAQGIYRLACLEQKESSESRILTAPRYLQLFERAAEMGHLQALCDIGYIYEKGIEGLIPANIERAHSYYLKAAKESFPRAMNNLASLYMVCPQLRQELKPIDLLSRAADLGYSKAFLNLAICYEKGKLVAQDRERAVGLFWRGARQDDEECKLFWVFNLIQQASEEEEDWAEGHRFCLQVIASNESKPEGYYFLGYMYEMGLGCPKEEQTSFLYYMKAARLDYPAAINKIGDFYHSGFGVERSRSLAFQYYTSAAEHDYPEALINLATIYEEGYEGVAASDPSRAIEYYQKACELGSSQAMLILCDFYQTGKYVRKNKDKAEEYLRRAAQLGSKVAAEMLRSKRL